VQEPLSVWRSLSLETFFAGRPPARAESQVPAQDSSITIHERWMDCICIIALRPDGWMDAYAQLDGRFSPFCILLIESTYPHARGVAAAHPV
jgi:hypothetical protein